MKILSLNVIVLLCLKGVTTVESHTHTQDNKVEDNSDHRL